MAAKALKDAGKKGTGKRLIAKSGGNRATLRTWRSLDKTARKTIRSRAEGGDIKNLTAYVEAIRTARQDRGVGSGSGRTPKPATSSRPGGTRGASGKASRKGGTSGRRGASRRATSSGPSAAMASSRQGALSAAAKERRAAADKKRRGDPAAVATFTATYRANHPKRVNRTYYGPAQPNR